MNQQGKFQGMLSRRFQIPRRIWCEWVKTCMKLLPPDSHLWRMGVLVKNEKKNDLELVRSCFVGVALISFHPQEEPMSEATHLLSFFFRFNTLKRFRKSARCGPFEAVHPKMYQNCDKHTILVPPKGKQQNGQGLDELHALPFALFPLCNHTKFIVVGTSH